MEREIGFYWLSMPLTQEWVIGHYNGDRFFLCGSDSGWFPEEFEEIGKKVVEVEALVHLSRDEAVSATGIGLRVRQMLSR